MPEPVKIFTAANSKVPEGSTHEYMCEFVDLSGLPIALAAILSVTAWLSDVATGTVLNRAAQDVKDVNGGVLTAGSGGRGVLTLTLTPGDARIVDDSQEEEQHRLVVKFTWSRGGALPNGETYHKVLYRVVNLEVIA